MADLMWAGGAMQFQDWAPWVWAVMGDWAKNPFYPTDPPRTPGAFYDSVAPICDFPLLGTAYAPFVSQYGLYYADQWDANPPGTSTSTSNPPSSDEDTSLAEKIDLLTLQVAALHTKLGSFVETDTTASLLYYLGQEVTGLPAPPTGFTTATDTARLLAAIAYVARAVCEQNTMIADLVSQTDLDAAVASVKGIDLPSIRTAQDAVLDAINGAANGITANVDSKAGAINANVDAAETAILAAMPEIPPAEQGGNFYPGSAGVTLGDPVVVTGPATITGPMSGLFVVVNAVPNGQSVQDGGPVDRYKGLAWVAFLTSTGEAEELQPLQFSKSLLKPNACLLADAAAVYCKSGGDLTVTPYTIN